MILSTDGVARLASGAFVCFESAGACACAEAAGATADTMHAIRTIAHSRKHLDTSRCEIMFVPARLCQQIRSGLPGPGCPIDAGFPFCPRKKRKKALQKVSDFPKACSRRRLYRCGRAAKVAADRYARQFAPCRGASTAVPQHSLNSLERQIDCDCGRKLRLVGGGSRSAVARYRCVGIDTFQVAPGVYRRVVDSHFVMKVRTG